VVYKMTIIVPVYNEEESLLRIEEVFGKYLSISNTKSKVLFVDDGSTDNSLSIIKKICINDHFDYIGFDKNYGLSSAIKAGIDYAQTPLIGYIDADLQTTPYDFDKLLEHIDDYSCVVGYRAKRADTFSKKIQSKVANYIRRSLIDDGIIDTGCPLKVFHSDVAKRIPFFDGMHRFWTALVLLDGGDVKQIEVQHFRRMEGQSKFNIFNRSVKPFQDIFAYRWMKSRYIKYNLSTKSF